MKRNGATPKGIERRLGDARFDKVGDPRVAAKVTYSLPAILAVLVAAVVTGARSLRQVEQRTLQIVKKLGSWRGLKKRIADNTFGKLLPRLRLSDLMAALHRMVKAEKRRGNLEPTRLAVGAVAIDGKNVATLRWHDLCRVMDLEDGQGQTPLATAELIEQVRSLLAERYPEAQLSVPKAGEPYALMRVHTVTLISSDAAPCIHQRPIPGETNEIGAMPALLLELKAAYGRTRLFRRMTTDAGNTSLAVAAQIMELGCHYFCQIKSIHGELHSEAVHALSALTENQALHSYSDKQNGELVTYHIWCHDLGRQGWLDWTHARQLVRVQRCAFVPRTGEVKIGNRYYVANQAMEELGPRSALSISRAHWRCENCTHWTVDAELQEDRRQLAWSRHPRGVLVVSTLRMMAMLILAMTRQLSRVNYSKEQPSWSQVVQHFFLQLCDSILETEAFDEV